jgi:7,8-dihydroneopterin aldolase/epimerase/oxygenase
MGKVALEGIEFHAYHGAYKEEKILGNRFTVDISVETPFKKAMFEDDLGETIDYAVLYQIVKSYMLEPVKLLEHLGHLIIEAILEAFPAISKVTIEIKKHNPALGGVVNFSVVTVQYPEDYV